MRVWQVRLFGKVSVQRDGVAVTGLPAKVIELLCYLLLFRDRGHAREVLADVLWPEASGPRARKYLRQTLWQLRTALDGPAGPGGARPDGPFAVDAGWVRLNPDAWWLDVEIFEAAHGICRSGPGPLTDRQAAALDDAVVLYRGDLIESGYQDWCVQERDRFQQIYLAMLDVLMSHCEVHHRYAEGVGYGQRILRHDPAREATHRQLMRLFHAAGDRAAALRQYDRCVAALAKQLDVRPSRETVTLYQRLRTDRGGRGELLPYGWAEPGRGEPGRGEAGRGEAGRGEAGRGEAGRGEAGRGEAGRGEPGRGEPGRGEAGRGEPGRGEPGRGEAGRGEAGWAGSGRDGPGWGEPGWPDVAAEFAGRVEQIEAGLTALQGQLRELAALGERLRRPGTEGTQAVRETPA
jgi:DNA-binding SARP family transcriptional activator